MNCTTYSISECLQANISCGWCFSLINNGASYCSSSIINCVGIFYTENPTEITHHLDIAILCLQIMFLLLFLGGFMPIMFNICLPPHSDYTKSKSLALYFFAIICLPIIMAIIVAVSPNKQNYDLLSYFAISFVLIEYSHFMTHKFIHILANEFLKCVTCIILIMSVGSLSGGWFPLQKHYIEVVFTAGFDVGISICSYICHVYHKIRIVKNDKNKTLYVCLDTITIICLIILLSLSFNYMPNDDAKEMIIVVRSITFKENISSPTWENYSYTIAFITIMRSIILHFFEMFAAIHQNESEITAIMLE